MRNARIGVILVVVWLFIGFLAVWQRGYFGGRESPDCERASTIVVTGVAGPLNYAGVNPKVDKCDLPQPSK
jgi:hypothetical protein